jgi:hypothetical protein
MSDGKFYSSGAKFISADGFRSSKMLEKPSREQISASASCNLLAARPAERAAAPASTGQQKN